jgi:hypothetical protein
MEETIPFGNFYPLSNIQFIPLTITTKIVNGIFESYNNFLTQYQVSNSGIVSISPYDKGIGISDNTLLQLKPERDIGPNKIDGKFVSLTFKQPIDDQNIHFVYNTDITIENYYGSISSDFSPLSLSPKTKVVPTSHYFDSNIVYSYGDVSSVPYHFYGGINNSPTATFGINNKTVVVDKTLIIPMNILDFDGDNVNWNLYNNNSLVTSGVSNNITEYYNFSPSISGLNTFKIVASDIFGFTTSSSNLYIDVIVDNEPSGFFLTQNHISFPYTQEYVEFSMMDLDLDVISYELFCNEELVCQGTTSKHINVKYPISLSKGIYTYSLVLSDVFVEGDIIQGPTIVVIDRINVQNY